LLHIGGKAGPIKWDVAQYKNRNVSVGNAKLAPLGSTFTDLLLKCSAATKIPPKVPLTDKSVHLDLGLLITLTFAPAILVAMLTYECHW
jgi:hypothetical protein